MRELWINIAHTGGARLYGLATNTIILAITARWLGPEGRGILGATTTWVMLFATVGCLSLGQVAIHHAARQHNENWLVPVLGSLLVVAGAVTVLGWGVAVAAYWVTDGMAFGQIDPLLLAIGFLMLPFLVWEQYGSSLLMAVDRLKVYNNAQLAAKTASIGVLLAVLALRLGIAGVLLVTLAAQIIVATAGLRELFRRAGPSVHPSRAIVKSLLFGGVKLHWNAVGTFLMLSSNVLVINYMCGPTEAGYYQFALQLIGVMTIIPTAAAMVLYGRVTSKGPDAAWADQRRVLVVLLCGMTVVAALTALAGPWLIPLVGGTSFAPAVRPFQWMLPSIIGLTISAVMGPQWVCRGLFWQASALTMSLGLLSLAISFVLTPHYGYWGAVWSLLVVYALSALINSALALWCELRFRGIRSAWVFVRPIRWPGAMFTLLVGMLKPRENHHMPTTSVSMAPNILQEKLIRPADSP